MTVSLKAKLVGFLTVTFILVVVDATEIDEDVNSLAVYLFAKLNQLKSNNAAKLTTRQARQIAKRSVIVDKETNKGLPPVVTYTRWGNISCPFEANTVYGGVAAGGANGHKGSPATLLCLPLTPSNALFKQCWRIVILYLWCGVSN